jgi:hypothetical protein
MTNPLTSAYAAEKANRSGTTSPDPTSAANPTADADLNEARGSALANALTGATKADVQPQPTVSDQRKCDHCGALETFWQTSEEDAETEGDDNEENEPSTQELLEGNDDGSDFEDRKKAAVNAAVAKVRAEHAIDEVNSKVNRAINAAVLEERKRIIESAPAVNVLKNAIRKVRGK